MIKKILSIVVLTVMLFSLVACNQTTSLGDSGQTTDKVENASGMESAVEEPKEPVAPKEENTNLEEPEEPVAPKEENTDSEAWEKRKEVRFSVAFKNVEARLTERDPIQQQPNIWWQGAIMINEYDEWLAFVQEGKVTAAKLIDRYSERYFEYRSIIYYQCATSQAPVTIDAVKIERHLTTVYLQVNVETGDCDALSGGNLVIEVNKNTVQSVSKIAISNVAPKNEGSGQYWENPNDEPFERKYLCGATLDDDFAEDSILVVLSREATRRFLTYTPEDFPEIDCIGVADLTEYTVEYVKELYDPITRKFKSPPADKQMLVDVYAFRRILCLKIANGSKEKVLQSIIALEARDDILSAEPNYIVHSDNSDPDPVWL